MIYSEAIGYIGDVGRAGSSYGTERMRSLLDVLGAPDERLRIVHVVGTNGKGSVTAYLTAALVESGYRVGTYNSPSVFAYNEKWLIDGEPLCDEDVAKYITAVKEAIDNENAIRSALGIDMLSPTAFEIETAVALLAFDDIECDICVIEAGLGGRNDATNAISEKLLSVITPIGLDHCALIGNTLKDIAAEKAAIIDGDAVTCAQCEEVMEQLRHPYDVVDGKKSFKPCNLIICKRPIPIASNLDGQDFMYDDEEYHISMLGEHQLVNAAIAICALKTLNERRKICIDGMKQGLSKAKLQARLEIVQNAKERFDILVPAGKTLVFDGAHNPHGAAALSAAAKFFGKIHLVIGVLKDKDVDGIVRALAPIAARATAVTPPSDRALDKAVLKEKLSKYLACDMSDDIRDAVQRALYDSNCDVVLLAGSLTLFSALNRDKL